MLDTTTGPGVDVAEGAIKLALLAMMQEVCRTADPWNLLGVHEAAWDRRRWPLEWLAAAYGETRAVSMREMWWVSSRWGKLRGGQRWMLERYGAKNGPTANAGSKLWQSLCWPRSVNATL
jgi:hypothetical protein